MSDAFNWLYSEKVMEHFKNPKNILEDEQSFEADGKGEVGDIRCGDHMLIVIKVKDGKVADCKWKTYGCASAIASTSVLSEIAKGMPLEEAYHIKPKDIVEKLGGLPENKFHCSVLGDRALRAAIEDYYRRNNMEDRITEEEARIVCKCMNVTDKDIEKAVIEGARDMEALQERTKLGTVCGNCKEKAAELLHEYLHLYG